MIDDGFVYHINYPSTIRGKSVSDDESDDFPIFKNGNKPPVIVIFGWAGSRQKHLAQYCSIYLDRGCIVFVCTATLNVLTYNYGKLPTIAERILDLVHEKSFNEHPIIFHVFSNGGTWLYQHVSRQMQKQKNQLQVKGVIFDSGLCRRRFYPLYRAFETVAGGPVYYKVSLALIGSTMLWTYWTLRPFIEAVMELKKPEPVDIFLEEEPYNWPQLLIYSKNDELTSWEDIEEFARRREEKGVKIFKLHFENSPHVQHLKTDRKAYIETVVNFTQTCLSPIKHSPQGKIGT